MSEHVQSTMTFPKDYCCSFKIDLKIGEGEQTRSKEDVHNMAPIMRSNLPNRVLATATIHQLDGSKWHKKDGQLSVHDLITYFRHNKTIHYHHLLLLPTWHNDFVVLGLFLSFLYIVQFHLSPPPLSEYEHQVMHNRQIYPGPLVLFVVQQLLPVPEIGLVQVKAMSMNIAIAKVYREKGMWDTINDIVESIFSHFH